MPVHNDIEVIMIDDASSDDFRFIVELMKMMSFS